MAISGWLGKMDEDVPAIEHVAREFFYSVNDARLWENEPEASKEYFRQCARKAIAFQKQHGMGRNSVNCGCEQGYQIRIRSISSKPTSSHQWPLFRR